jgi:tRNA 2-thiouridine synthesizing protein B
MTLIIVKFGPNNVAEKIKIAAGQEGDSIVLVQDGIFWALEEIQTEADVYAVTDDVVARGYSEDDITVPMVDFKGFVEIIEKCEKSIS